MENAELYINKINIENQDYLEKILPKNILDNFNFKVKQIKSNNIKEAVQEYSILYEKTIKKLFQLENKTPNEDNSLDSFLNSGNSNLKLVFGDAKLLYDKLPSESIQLMVTSPPYYNAREYSVWKDIESYKSDMQEIINKAYRVLDNHRMFIFNVGDIFDNKNMSTNSVWGKERIPLGSYFVTMFEKAGFKFIDDFIWDKGEVQSSRHKNSFRPYPFYQYPVNVYEHILVFAKHRLDKIRYPCPVCGSLKVNGNTQSSPGIQSWECKNFSCFERSKSNRGKRFSLISNIKQRNQVLDNKIPDDLLNKWRRDIVKFSPVIKISQGGKNKLGHTAPFPKDIPEMATEFFSFKGEFSLDPFAGSFTSAITTAKLGRIGIGFEIHKEFEESAKKRMKMLNYNGSYETYDLETGKIKFYKGSSLNDVAS